VRCETSGGKIVSFCVEQPVAGHSVSSPVARFAPTGSLDELATARAWLSQSSLARLVSGSSGPVQPRIEARPVNACEHRGGQADPPCRFDEDALLSRCDRPKALRAFLTNRGRPGQNADDPFVLPPIAEPLEQHLLALPSSADSGTSLA
jgi:hypothetical protein